MSLNKNSSGRKVGRRETIWFLLTGAGLLGGCVSPSGYKPALPESCEWLKFPYTWVCIDPKEGNMPVPKQETEMWKPLPLDKLDWVYEEPISYEELRSLRKEAECLLQAIDSGPLH